MCGTTRAWQSLFGGDIKLAFECNPLFLFWTFWCVIALLDPIERAIKGESPAMGERLLRFVSSNNTIVWMHAGCFLLLVVYLNTIGPTSGH